jgi:hypothetical protein
MPAGAAMGSIASGRQYWCRGEIIRQFPRQALGESDDFADVMVAQILAELHFRHELMP